MILERSTSYWSTGIVLTWHPDGARNGKGEKVPGWSGAADYLDDGWIGDDNADAGMVSTQGELTTRYPVADGETRSGLSAVIDALIADGTRLGIRFGATDGTPFLYVPGDGERAEPVLPEGWRGLLAVEAERIGWETYRSATTVPLGQDVGDGGQDA